MQWGARWRTVLVAVLVVPLLVWAVAWILQGWVPQGDEGWIALKTHDVFSAHPPLLGMRSTSDQSWHGVWAHHPGPLEFYVLAVPYAAAGFRPAGLLCGCVLMDAAMIALAVHHAWVAGRRNGVAVVVTAVLGSELLLGPCLVVPWNPWPPVLGLVALLTLGWRLLLRDVAVLPWFIAVGSLVLQADLALVAFLTPLLLVLAVVGLLRWRAERHAVWPLPGWRRRPPQPWGRPGVASIAVGAVLWLPAGVELFVVSPNNASQLWLVGQRAMRGPEKVIGAVALLAGCVWAAHRIATHERPAARAVARWVSALVAAGVAVSIVAGGRTRLIYLVMSVGAIIFAIAVWRRRPGAAGHALRVLPPVGWGIVGVAVALCLGPGGPVALPFTTAELGNVRRAGPVASRVLTDLRARGVRGGAVVVRADGFFAFGSYESAVVARLATDGYRPYFDTAWPYPEDDSYRRIGRAPADATQVTVRDQGAPSITPTGR